MAIIDRVYRTVQDILNKEQRGYITPEEFNNMAHLAQNEIFETYFHDYNFFENAMKAGRTNTEYADLPKHFRERINKLSAEGVATFANNVFTLPADLYRLITVIHGGNNIEEEEFDKIQYAELSPLAKATTGRPVYTRLGGDLKIYPSTINSGVTVSYIRRPKVPKWTYIVSQGTAIFAGNTIPGIPTASDYQDFEIHEADEHELVIKILKYAGIIIREADISTLAEASTNSDTQNEFRI